MDTAIWLYRRVAGVWTPVRELTTDTDIAYIWSRGISMRNGIAALALHPVQVFEKVGGDWQSSPVFHASDEPGSSISVDGSRFLYGGSSGPYQGRLYEKDSNGVWSPTAHMPGEYRGGDDEREGGNVDLAGRYAAIMSEDSDEPSGYATPNVTLYYDYGPAAAPNRWRRAWTFATTASNPFRPQVQVRGTEVFIAGTHRTGAHVFQRQPGGQWPLVDHLQPLNAYAGGDSGSRLHKSPQYILQASYSHDDGASVIHAYAKDAQGRYQQVATLLSSDGTSLGNFAISDRTVIASCGDQACVFDLPATLAAPEPLQETFGGSTAGWSFSPGSQFTLVQSGVSRVLRQNETAGTATHAAVLTASNWSNQSVQADLKATAFNGNDRWVGLATRYADANNFYYVTMRASGSISLRRNVAGVFSPIASAPFDVDLNRNYRLRLESIGTRHRVYANGVLLLDADDASLASGRAALLTYRAAADFDNVVVSPAPTATLWTSQVPVSVTLDDFITDGPGVWARRSLGGEIYFEQSAVSGDARAVTGTPTGDQSIDVTARATQFGGTGEHWFGVVTRYTDASNFYYLTVRSSGSVSLRKVVDGQITVLGTYPRPVAPGTWYRLRLESVGNQHRAYVNDRLTLEATDSAHAVGRTGLATFRTAADYLRNRAIQP